MNVSSPLKLRIFQMANELAGRPVFKWNIKVRLNMDELSILRQLFRTRILWLRFGLPQRFLPLLFHSTEPSDCASLQNSRFSFSVSFRLYINMDMDLFIFNGFYVNISFNSAKYNSSKILVGVRDISYLFIKSLYDINV